MKMTEHRIPDFIQKKISQLMLDKYVMTYIKFQHENGVIKVVGANVESFNFSSDMLGRSVEETLFFTSGLLPLNEDHLFIPSVEYDENKYMDVHLIHDDREPDGCDWIVCQDRSEELHWQQMAQQKSNELLLKAAESQASNSINYFDLYDAIVFDYQDDEDFRQLVKTPQLFQHHFPETFSLHKSINLLQEFPFLESFVIDARELWFEKGSIKKRRSGPWLEEGKDGQELALEAVAHNWQGKKLLTIEFLDERYEQQLKILQMGREEALMRQQAEYANREKSKFLATISHELRTPLNVVIGFTELCQNQKEKNVDFLEKILVSSKNLLSLIDNILDYSKLEAGKLAIESYDFELAKELAELESMFSYLAKEKGIQFKLQVEPGIPKWLKGDPIRLKQVLMNLIANAIKFTSDGQVKVHIAQEKQKDNTRWLKFTVTDTGIGISEKQQHKIFEAFTQAENSTARKYGGTGLGLAICKNLVGQMGGDFQLQSQLGVGSNFIFRIPHFSVDFLPVNNSNETSLKNTQDRPFEFTGIEQEHLENGIDEVKIPSGCSLLLVEDQKLNRDLVKELIKPYRLKIKVADNGLSAVAKVITENFDCILMDINMPIMDGYQATKLIRERCKDKAVPPIIGLTANDSQSELQKSIRVGMDDMVPKPIDREILISKIAQWINLKQFQNNYKK